MALGESGPRLPFVAVMLFVAGCAGPISHQSPGIAGSEAPTLGIGDEYVYDSDHGYGLALRTGTAIKVVHPHAAGEREAIPITMRLTRDSVSISRIVLGDKDTGQTLAMVTCARQASGCTEDYTISYSGVGAVLPLFIGQTTQVLAAGIGPEVPVRIQGQVRNLSVTLERNGSCVSLRILDPPTTTEDVSLGSLLSLGPSMTFCPEYPVPTEFESGSGLFRLVSVKRGAGALPPWEVHPVGSYPATQTLFGASAMPPEYEPFGFFGPGEGVRAAQDHDEGFRDYLNEHPTSVLRYSYEERRGDVQSGASMVDQLVGERSATRALAIGAPGSHEFYHVLLEKRSRGETVTDYVVLESGRRTGRAPNPSIEGTFMDLTGGAAIASSVLPYEVFDARVVSAIGSPQDPFSLHDRWWYQYSFSTGRPEALLPLAAYDSKSAELVLLSGPAESLRRYLDVRTLDLT